MKTFLTIILLALSINSSFAAEPQKTKPSVSDIENKYKNKIDYTEKQKSQMMEMLHQNKYNAFFDFVKANPVSGVNYILFLNSVKDEGHVPLYWLMADYYSNQTNKEQETHMWYYTAMIMTTQDSYLCYDPTAKYAAEKLSRSFPKALALVRNTPQYIGPAMNDVTYFISNIKERISPLWACGYGTSPRNPNNKIMLDPSSWEEIRDKVFDKFTEKYQQ